MSSTWFTKTMFLLLWLTINGVYADSAGCSSSVQAMMKRHITHTLDFCNWYISRNRQISPLPKIDATEIIANCVCLGAIKPATVPAPSGPAVTTSPAKCVPKDVATVKANFALTPSFCKFYNAWSYTLGTSPIKKLSAQRTYNACSCIISGSSTITSSTQKPTSSSKKSLATSSMVKSSTTKSPTSTKAPTTAALPFCSSSAVMSLAADSYASTFCGSILGLTASTQTVYVPSTTRLSETTVQTKDVSTLVTVTQEEQPYTSTITNTVWVHTLTEICGTTGYMGLSKRDLATPTPLSTPAYLAPESPAFQTSACGCLPYTVTAATISETLVTEVPVTTFVTEVITSVITVDVPVYHQSTLTDTHTVSSTSTIYTPYSSLAQSTTLDAHPSVTFQIVPQYTFVYGYGHQSDAYCDSGSCTSFSDCMATCATDSDCVAAKYYDEGNGRLGCSLSTLQYGGVPLAADNLCLIKVDNTNLGSAIVVHRS